MHSLVAFALLAVSVSAAPGAILQQAVIPAALPVTFTHQVQVPVTKTVHYDVKNVVTGYSTSIIKPAIPAVPALAPFVTHVQQPAIVATQPAVVAAPAPAVVAGQFPFQLPPFPNPPADTPNPGSGGSGNYPQLPQFPAFPPVTPPPSGGDTTPNPVGQLPGGSNPAGNLPGTPGGPPAPMPDINNPPQIPGAQPTPAPPTNFPNFPQFPQYPGQEVTTSKPPVPSGSESPVTPGTNAPNDATTENPFPNPAPAPVAVEAVPAPAPAVEIQSDDTEVVSNPEFRSAVVQPAAVQNVIQAAPVAVAAPAPLTFAAPAPIAVAPQRIQLHRDTPANVVSQQQVLAPVRTHTQITPQITQIQPEVTVRKVIHDVPVATPVVAQPIVAHQPLAFAGQHVVAPGFNFAF